VGKPWAKYEVDFINHNKFQAISANAICLWIEGKNYADGQLTDGFLPRHVVKGFRFYSKKSIDLLMASAGPKSASGTERYRPLWEATEHGWQMHDYLEHNDCREKTLERIERDRKRKGRRNSARIPRGTAA